VDKWEARCKLVPDGVLSSLPRGGWQLEEVAAEAGELANWTDNGLPTDEAAKEGAIIAMRSLQPPLCIDPQGHARLWLQQTILKDGGLVVEASSAKLTEVLEAAAAVGSTVLVTDCVEPLAPQLMPWLFSHRPDLLPRQEDQPTALQARLFLTTMTEKPSFSTALHASVAVVNFVASFDGLVERWLSLVVRCEQPAVDQHREELRQLMRQDEVELERLTFECLQLLAESEGEILDRPELIEHLQQSKEEAGKISRRLGKAQLEETTLECHREEYRVIGVHVALLYFAWSAVASTSALYWPSVALCTRLLQEAVVEHQAWAKEQESAETKKSHIEGMLVAVRRTIYSQLSKGLFQKDRFVFGLEVAMQLSLLAGDITDSQVSFLLRGADGEDATASPSHQIAQDHPYGIEKHTWHRMNRLASAFPVKFGALPGHVKQNTDTWYHFLTDASDDSVDQEKEPCVWFRKRCPWAVHYLPIFEQIMLIQVVCPKILSSALKEYVTATLGDATEAHRPNSVRDAVSVASSTSPVILLSEADFDVVEALSAEAEQHARALQVLSFGAEQGTSIASAIERSRRKGAWLLLENTHLTQEWPPAIVTAITASFLGEKSESNFRLFIHVAAPLQLPKRIVDHCGKIALECPQGIRSVFLEAVSSRALRSSSYLDEGAFGSSGCGYTLLAGCALLYTCLRMRKQGRLSPSAGVDTHSLWSTLRLWDGSTAGGGATSFLLEAVYGGWMESDEQMNVLQALVAQLLGPGRSATSRTTLAVEMLQAEQCTSDHNPMSWLENFAEKLPSAMQLDFFGLSASRSSVNEEKVMLSDALALLRGTHAHGPSPWGADRSHAVVDTGRDAQMIAEFLQELPPLEPLQGTVAGLTDAQILAIGASKHDPNITTALFRFLSRELESFNRLLHQVHQSLCSAQRAVAGEENMSEGLEAICVDLAKGNLPTAWKAFSYASCRPLGSWLQDLRLRVETLRRWAASEDLPASFWIGHYFAPSRFFISVLQGAATTLRLAVDDLEFKHTVQTSAEPDAEHEGVCVDGLYLDGASWDAAAVRLEERKMERVGGEMMPTIRFVPRAIDAPPPEPDSPQVPVGGRQESWRKMSQVSISSFALPRWSIQSIGSVQSVELSPVNRRRKRHATVGRALSTVLPNIAPPPPLARYACPVHRTAARNGGWSSAGHAMGTVCTVHLDTAVDPAEWTLRGVALLCEPSC